MVHISDIQSARYLSKVEYFVRIQTVSGPIFCQTSRISGHICGRILNNISGQMILDIKRLDNRSIRPLNQGFGTYSFADLSLQSQFQGFPSRATPCRLTGSSPDSWVSSFPFRCNRSIRRDEQLIFGLIVY